MADNINLTNGQVVRAADFAGVLLPYNVICNVDGAPVNLATSALQVSANSLLTTIAARLPALSGGDQPVVFSNTSIGISGPVAVTGTFFQATQPVSLASLPLPAGAATASLQATSNALLDAIGVVLGSPLQAGGSVAVAGTVAVTGTFFQATQPVSFTWAGLTDAQLRAAPVPTAPNVTRGAGAVDANTQRVTLASDGAGVTVLSSIDTKTPALGQALEAASSPVVLTAAQITALAPLSTVAVSNFPATQPVSGTVAVTGVATEATLAARIPVNGQAAMAASVPVVLASNQTAIPVVEAATVLDGQAAQTATINNILPATAGAAATASADLRSASVQVVSTGTGGTFIFEQSNDDVNYVALPVFNSALTTGVPIVAAITATASAIIYSLPVRARFVRLRIATTITGGSIQAFSRFSTEPWTPTAATVSNPTAANLAVTASLAATQTLTTLTTVGTLSTITAGANLIADVGLQVRANATGAATAFNYASPATSAGTQVKATAGRLLSIALTNTSAALRYVKLFNVSAAPTMGTTSALYEYAIPVGGSINITVLQGIAHATGIFIAVTTAVGLTNNTSTSVANDVVGFLAFA